MTACASGAGEDVELPETLVDGAADSWSRPTDFGNLFQGVWQFGEVDSERNMKFPAWTFALTADASVTVTSRVAPTDEPTLTASVAYLYKQREAGTWKRIARTPAGADFAKLTRSLGEGTYRVIIKGLQDDAQGELLLRMDCTGAGCATGDQCLIGSTFSENLDRNNGALHGGKAKVLTAASVMSDALKAQIIAAVNESSHEVTTIAGAFEAVDGHEVNRYRLWDGLLQRPLIAIEFGAGDNSYGAIFDGDTATKVAAIHDGDIDSCTVAPRSCVFGQSTGDAAFMPDMKKTGDRDLKATSSIDAVLAKQIIAALTYENNVPTLAEAFDTVDENMIYADTFKHADGREFVFIHYYSGDTAVGTYFKAGTTEKLAEMGDGDLSNCTAY